MIKHIIIVLTLILIVAGSCKSDAQQYKHSTFYLIKNEVKDELVSVAKENKQTVDVNEIKAGLEKRLGEIASKHSHMDYTVFVEKSDDITASTVLIGYEDDGGFIGWKFDSIYSEQKVFMFSKTLKDRKVDFQSPPEDYYQWEIVK